jgi:aryl-alcohol dehydrogenase-like predicted oxidoreductase
MSFKVLDAAFESGMRYFDCAASYGMSELFMAEWLSSRRIDPEDVLVRESEIRC